MELSGVCYYCGCKINNKHLITIYTFFFYNILVSVKHCVMACRHFYSMSHGNGFNKISDHDLVSVNVNTQERFTFTQVSLYLNVSDAV